MGTQPAAKVASRPPTKKDPIPETGTIESIGDLFVDGLEKNLDWIVDGYDKDSSVAPDLEAELRRLAVLKSYRLVGSSKNPSLERLISMASRIMRCPMAKVNVIDLGKVHFLASRGLGDTMDAPRKTSISSHAIISKLDLLIVPDLLKDERFKGHPHVQGPLGMRFFAAAPLQCPEGYRLGTLTIMDTEPRPEGLTLDEKQSLRELADMVMDVMVEHRESKNHQYRQPAQLIACTSNDLITPLKGVLSGLSSIAEDKSLHETLSSQQQDLIRTAVTCSSVMGRMCMKSIHSFHLDPASVGTFGTMNAKRDDSLLNIHKLVKHLHTVMEPFPKQVPMVITTAPSVPDIVVADELKIFRSAVNYLTNACATTKTGSVHLKIYLRDDEDNVDSESQNIVFSVEDTSPGISVDKYQYLFQPKVEDADPLSSYCVDSLLGSATSAASKTKMQSGSLGLYSVAMQIKSIGGKYGFRPRGFTEYGSQCLGPNGEPMKGSVFWFSIPLVLPSQQKAAQEEDETFEMKDAAEDDGSVNARSDNLRMFESSEELTGGDRRMRALLIDDDEETFEMKDAAEDDGSVNARSDNLRMFESSEELTGGDRRMRALLIDDDVVCRKSIANMLTKVGFDVVVANNGVEGLQALKDEIYDLVLCDFLMPVLDGIDCVRQYRQFEVAHRPWFDQFIVGISGHVNEEDVERGLKAGMNDYRSKPITKEDLEEIIESPEFQYVKARLDEIAFENEEDAHEAAMQVEMGDGDSEEAFHVCLVATESGSSMSDIADKIEELPSWKAINVEGGEAALRLLKMRNWDAVFLDDELSGLTSSQCVAHFRDWEQKNRVNKQKHVLQISSSFIPTEMESKSSSMQLPVGFDGALGKPLS
eukprot:CAMPEP_0113609674 /NCGR_PEP_ID=MMETSP0017_2-20120614/4621_1 /TAXON_ID=2856 /ORGANISM="Cylindrotheca closterium" /LENGTH=871 /DNA_ID=CAMNT_0000518515 /DNA_START=30 /DNA_END=2642 /DNA_ORIENTATION=+ /assembly_acc=CAM_ASM_000147